MRSTAQPYVCKDVHVPHTLDGVATCCNPLNATPSRAPTCASSVQGGEAGTSLSVGNPGWTHDAVPPSIFFLLRPETVGTASGQLYTPEALTLGKAAVPAWRNGVWEGRTPKIAGDEIRE